MMVAEIGVGWWSGSMALLADGWHMGTHAGAIGLAGLAYWFARTRANTQRFSFGTGKVHALAAWTNALLLLGAGGWLVVDSVVRLWRPLPLNVGEALPIAVLGLVVNLVSAGLLSGGGESAGVADAHGHDHAHGHGHGHAHATGDHDLNRRSAYLHVLMDLLTSVTAIGALVGAWLWGFTWLDPLMGALGAALVVRWGTQLLAESGRQLLDMAPEDETMTRIKAALEQVDDVRVADLHVWELGFGRRACMVSLVTHAPRDPGYYRAVVEAVTPIQHLTIEIHRCPNPCEAA
jgi:cation diffusion facilitator family transporter